MKTTPILCPFEMKQCFKCGVSKPLDEFYRHPQMGDGHLNKCKECTKRDAAEHYARLVSTPEGLAAERARGREKNKRLNYTARYRGKSRKYQAAYQARYPEKQRARTAVHNALRDGKIARPKTCEECGASGRIEGHHADYGRPLDVAWLCHPCHMKRHRKEEAA